MKAYIAGKISGDPKYYEKFQTAETALTWEKFIVLNPAELPKGMRPGDYMRVCFAMIDIADVVAFLPDWEDSRGARLEHDYCEYIGKQTLHLASLRSYQQLTAPTTIGGF